MEIIREDIDELNARLNIHLTKEDYEGNYLNSLKKIKKDASMKGFRKGMVPIGMLKKMYGKQVLLEEIDKVVSGSLNDYLRENEIKILAQPLMVEDEHFHIDAQELKELTFKYEIGIAPDFEITALDGTTEAEKYKVSFSDEDRQEEIERLQKQNGHQTNPEKGPLVESDVISIELTELAEGKVKEGSEPYETSLAVDQIMDFNVASEVMNLNPGDETDIPNLYLALDKSKEDVCHHVLGIHGDHDYDHIGESFRMKLNKITRMEPADLDQDFYDRMFGPENVKSEEEFKEKLDEKINEVLVQQAEAKLKVDTYHKIIEATEIPLPADFLKKYIKRNNEKPIDDAQIDEGFENFQKELKWSLIQGKIVKDNELEVDKEELVEKAKEETKNNYLRYTGMELPDDQLDQFAASMLNDEKYVNEMYTKLLEEKTFENIISNLKIVEKEISLEDFKNLN